jgi:hypothetical protein
VDENREPEAPLTFKIEPIREWTVSDPRRVYPHSKCGVLVTGYPEGGDWLVSPTGRPVRGHAFKDAPEFGWALAEDRLLEHMRPRLYILDFPRRSIREVEGLELSRHREIVGDYDGEHLIVLAELKSETDKWAREVVVIDIATARTVHRFATAGIAFQFFGPTARTPDGWLKKSAHGHDPRRDAWGPGFVAIHPLMQESAFHPFPLAGYEDLTISPSGRHVLREGRAHLPVRDLSGDHPASTDFDGMKRRYGRSVQLWSPEPFAFRRNLVLGWFGVGELPFLGGDVAARRRNLEVIAELCAQPRAEPLSAPERSADRLSKDAELREIANTHWEFASFPWRGGKSPLVWQEDETAFWWNWLERWTCVGLDGEISPPIVVKGKFVSFVAKPGRIGEIVVELDGKPWTYVLDGSPSADPCTSREAPIATPSPTDDERQRKAQAALTRLIQSATELRVSAPTLGIDDCVRAIDEIASALDRGLKSYTDNDHVLQVRIEVADAEFDEARFFAHVEGLGFATARALRRLVERCCADPDMWTVWSGDLEDGCQAFGAAAKALGAVDVRAWPLLARYFMHVDDFHEGFFRGVTERHFIARHGWRDESFDLALSVIVQMRGNLGDAYVPVWKGLGLSAAAERVYTPAQFAARMLAVRDRMVSDAAGSFAAWLALRAKNERPSTFGWPTYDDLFAQVHGDLTTWERRLFEDLKRRSSPTGRLA